MKKSATLLSGLCLALSPWLGAEPSGLDFVQVNSTNLPPERTPKAQSRPLGLAELQQLLGRLAPIKVQASDRSDFALRPSSQPVPKAGKRIPQAFGQPAPEGPAPGVEVKPVEVLRYGPQGEVDVAAQVSLTFNQPMVELSSAASPAQVPVKLTPETPGEWRWVGTQTLVFQPQQRLPMASEFRAELSPLAAPNGSRLQAPLSWTFATPAPQLKQSYPSGGDIGLRPLIFLEFDQRVDPAVVAQRLQPSHVSLRLATPQEVLRDEQVSRLQTHSQPGRSVVLIPTSPLQPGQHYGWTLPAGTPSLEGPRTTSEPQSFGFATYQPLQVLTHSSDEQPPESPLVVNFNNRLDPQTLKAHPPLLEPPLEGMRSLVRGHSLFIYGRTRGRTRYTLTVPAALGDKWGQTLGRPHSHVFQIGSASPMFVPPSKEFVLLDPLGPPQLTFTTINHKALEVEVYAVQPQDWQSYQQALGLRWESGGLKLPGQLLQRRSLSAEGAPDQLREVALDLKEAFNKSSQLVVVAWPEGDDQEERRARRYIGWIQRTQLGLNFSSDNQGLLAWVTDLAEGRPLAGAKVRLLGQESAAAVTSDAQGLAQLPWKGASPGLLVEHREQTLFLPASLERGTHDFRDSYAPEQLLWYVNDDRRLYKPGETVAIKGWLRRQIHRPRGGLALPEPATSPLSYTLFDSRGNQLLQGTTSLGALGGFDFKLELPKNVHLGQARLDLHWAGQQHSHSFQVEEFRRPEFEVSTRALSGSCLLGGRGSLEVEAKYYAGGGLKDAQVNWSLEAQPSNYHPPQWEGYSFGSWTPWWDCHCWWARPSEPSQSKSFSGRTQASGKSRLDLEFRSADPARPYRVEATATVMDVNRQAWSSSSQLLVHPAQVYVGIRAASNFVEPGQPLVYRLIATDLEGKAVAGRKLQVKAYRLTWDESEDGGSKREEMFSQTLTSAAEPIEVKVPTSQGGTVQLEVVVEDEANRRNHSEITSWVAGEKSPPQREVAMQQLTLVPNKKDYQPGEVAEILVQSPFAGAQALVTLERHGLVSKQLLDLSRGSATLKVPLEEDFIPNLWVNVEAVGSQLHEGRKIPAQAQASLNLALSTASRQLKVEVAAAQAKSQPGAANAVRLKLRDAQGRPLQRAEVALYVVDEALLALAGGDYSDPGQLFNALRSSDTRHSQVRQYLELALARELEVPPPPSDGVAEESAMPAPSAAPGAVNFTMNYNALHGSTTGARFRAERANKAKEQAPAIRVRRDFSPLAFYAPRAHTNEAGEVNLPFKLPDNLTRYRVVALAVAGKDQFGLGQSALVAQQPLMLRPSPPRFLNFGDRCQLPITLQNQSDKPLQVKLACRASNLKLDPAQAGFVVEIPANDRREVRIPLAADKVGRARFQVAATCQGWSDAAEVDFPVWTPATSQAVASYGTLDQGALEQVVARPPEVFDQFGGLEVSTSSTALAELTDAFLYLQGYPYECAEQLSSRVLSTLALAPVLQAFEAPGMPSASQLKLSLAADIKKLQGMQNSDGGWDYWVRDHESVPYVSLHVCHALVRLQQAGHSLPEGMLDQALGYVESLPQHFPSHYAVSTQRSLRAYALFVLKTAGRPDPKGCRELLGEWGGVDKTPLESLGWLLPSLSKDKDPQSQELLGKIRRHLNNRVTETASKAHFVNSFSDQDYLVLASEHRDDAILLEALIQDQPDSDLLPKLVRGLLDHRQAGRWANTQENCFVLLALERYFRTFEKVKPDFVARLWLGQHYGGQQIFKGRSADSKELNLPMKALQGRQTLTLSKDGPGRLYYRLGLRYAPLQLQQQAMERGFSLERRYEAVGDNREVQRDSQGRWHLKAGAQVKVHLTMVCPSERHHVALVDPLPAGLEPLNPALQGTAPRPSAPSKWWWNSWWYEHENLRDERVEVFSQSLPGGVYHYDYYARATTPGQFVVPPLKAEEMYHPETFGHSASDQVIVED